MTTPSNPPPPKEGQAQTAELPTLTFREWRTSIGPVAVVEIGDPKECFAVLDSGDIEKDLIRAELIVTAVNSHSSLLASHERLKQALEWYADKVSGIHGNDDAEALEADQGTRANTALLTAHSVNNA